MDIGVDLSGSSTRRLVSAIKENFCYVALKYDEELEMFRSRLIESTYFLPGGPSPLEVRSQKIECAEALFQPRIFGIDVDGIHQRVSRCFESVDFDFLLY